jgi:hypothetical protein
MSEPIWLRELLGHRTLDGPLGARAGGAGPSGTRGQPVSVPGDQRAGGDRRGDRAPSPGTLRRLSGVESRAPSRRHRVHLADARAGDGRARLRGGSARRGVHRREGGARPPLLRRGARPPGHARGGEGRAHRPLLHLQSDQSDGHRDAASADRGAHRRESPWPRSGRAILGAPRVSGQVPSRRLVMDCRCAWEARSTRRAPSR